MTVSVAASTRCFAFCPSVASPENRVHAASSTIVFPECFAGAGTDEARYEFIG
jgi:hypothetical protein